jgi:hypothetical protein
MSAFQLRNRDMHTFEARQQAWRGTSREYADAGWQVSFSFSFSYGQLE